MRGDEVGFGGGGDGGIGGVLRGGPGADLFLFNEVEGGVFLVDGAEGGTLGAVELALPLGLVVEDGGVGLELVEDEEQRAEEHDEELHRNLEESVEHEAEAAFAQVGAADVALDLGLVGAEVGE